MIQIAIEIKDHSSCCNNCSWQCDHHEAFPVLCVETGTGLAALLKHSQVVSWIAKDLMDPYVETGRENILSAALSASHWEISGLGLLTGCVEGTEGEKQAEEKERRTAVLQLLSSRQKSTIFCLKISWQPAQEQLRCSWGCTWDTDTVSSGPLLLRAGVWQQVWCWVVRNSCSEVCMGKRALCHTCGKKVGFDGSWALWSSVIPPCSVTVYEVTTQWFWRCFPNPNLGAVLFSPNLSPRSSSTPQLYMLEVLLWFFFFLM